MVTSLFGSSVPTLTVGRSVRQEFTGSAGQTLFTLSSFTYTPGANTLEVYINGQRQGRAL